MQPDSSSQLVIFLLDRVRYAIPLAAVQRVLRPVELTQLPSGSDHICGVINMHGTILPVIDTRHVLGLPSKEIALDDVYIIARTGKRTMVLIVDAVDRVVDISCDNIITSTEIIPELKQLTGLTRLDNDIVLIQDLELCLTEHDLSCLDSGIIAEAGA